MNVPRTFYCPECRKPGKAYAFPGFLEFTMTQTMSKSYLYNSTNLNRCS